MNRNDIQQAIDSGGVVLGVEFGSTRIKAVLIGEDHMPIASGSYNWENRYENSVWTYSLEDIWTGLQESYRELQGCFRELRCSASDHCLHWFQWHDARLYGIR